MLEEVVAKAKSSKNAIRKKAPTQESSCQDCGKTFKYKKILEKHVAMHRGEHPFWCKLCMENFETLEKKKLHNSNAHPVKAKKRKCKFCPALVFETKEELFLHTTVLHAGNFSSCFMCSECAKQFKTKSELTHHTNSKCGTIKLFQCSVCSLNLMTAGSLHNHMLIHNGERSHMCGYCGKRFLTIGQLQVHERTHTQDKAFVCEVCGKGFCHRQSLITHSTLHTGVKPFQCENCSHAFSCVGNLMKHRRTHPDTCGSTPVTTHRVNNSSTKMKIQINTPKCVKLKTLKKEQELEMKLAAYKEKIKLEGLKTDDQALVQEEVMKESSSKVKSDEEESVKVERSTSSDEETLKTEEEIVPDSIRKVRRTKYRTEIVKDLKTNFPNEENLARESSSGKVNSEPKSTDGEKSSGSEEEVPENSIRKMRSIKYRTESIKETKAELQDFLKERNLESASEAACSQCGKVYTNWRWLLKHEKKHQQGKIEKAKLKLYVCKCCSQGFETREEHKSHQKSEHQDILTCQDCEKIFSNVDSLRSHQNIYHKGYPRKVYLYICEKCGLQFRQKAMLVHHESSNCGSGLIYPCEVCGKGFSSTYTRTSHQKIHDPKKKFLCKFCGKEFRWKGQLKIHERSHTGEKPFKCLYCPKAFAYRESLVTHSSLHTGIKPHVCQACGSRFSCIGNLIKHRVTHATTCGSWYSKNNKQE